MRIISGIYLAFVSIPSKSKPGLYKNFQNGYLHNPNTNQDKGREAVRTLSLAWIPPNNITDFKGLRMVTLQSTEEEKTTKIDVHEFGYLFFYALWTYKAFQKPIYGKESKGNDGLWWESQLPLFLTLTWMEMVTERSFSHKKKKNQKPRDNSSQSKETDNEELGIDPSSVNQNPETRSKIRAYFTTYNLYTKQPVVRDTLLWGKIIHIVIFVHWIF